MTLLRKIWVMALLGALGATFGAALGEALFAQPVPKAAARRICLLFDISGSMAETIRRENGGRITQMEALKNAASDFIARQNLKRDFVGMAVFSTDANMVSSLTHDSSMLQSCIRQMVPNGGTNLGRGFDVAGDVLAGESGERWVLVFTDGKPETSSTRESPTASALNAAARLRSAGVKIVAIVTPLADVPLLGQATGSPENVIVSDASALNKAFERSEEIINRQMLASAGSAGFTANALLAGTWAALVAIGAGIGLVMAQNRHTRRRILGMRQALLVALGGAFTGLAAGFAGQSIYYVLASLPAFADLGRIVSWCLLGFGLGYGMGSIVPNLVRSRAAISGAAAGLGASFCFMVLDRAGAGDSLGRLLGAAIFGLALGLVTVIIEAACREAWVVVHWGPRERSKLSLGENPILVGASQEAHVLIAEEDSPSPIMARISLVGGIVRMDDHAGRTRTLSSGEILEYGRIRIEICASGAASGFSGPERSGGATDPVSRARAREAVKQR